MNHLKFNAPIRFGLSPWRANPSTSDIFDTLVAALLASWRSAPDGPSKHLVLASTHDPDDADDAPAADDARPLDRGAEQTLRTHFAGAKVLLAEDNPVSQEVAMSLLQLAGLLVDVAETGLEAVSMASIGSYDLILMDMQMPAMDGLQATRLLRESAVTAATPIIAMTANAYSDDRSACLAAGMNDYLSKPVDPQVLYRLLAQWLPRMPLDAIEAPVVATDEMRGIDGVDMVRGMAYFADNRAAYERALEMFVDLHRQSVRLTLDYLANPSPDLREALHRETHSLGGACAAIGARSLGEKTAGVSAALKDDAVESQVSSALRSMLKELTDLVAHIEVYLSVSGSRRLGE